MKAVVVGAGHNGLVAACYLARAGVDVTVLERDTVVGGAVSTVERWPGFRVDRGSSAHVMIRHTGIVQDLDLDVQYVDLDPWGYAPFGDQGITFRVDLDDTCTSIERVCGARDADAYRAFVLDWGARNRRVMRAFQQVPTPGRLGRTIWGMGRGTGLGGVELSRQFLTSGDALLDAHFDDERLKTALAWLGAQSGPATHEPATADLVGWTTLLHDLPPGRPLGGSGALSEALAAKLSSYGGELRLGDGAAALTTTGGRVDGVTTQSGDHVAADVVVGACHVLTTLELLGDEQLLERARRTVRVGNGIGMVVRLATRGLPTYPDAPSDVHHALQLLAPSRQALRRAHGEWSAGLPPTEPAALAMCFSAVDPGLAPPGRHSVSVWGQWHPYALSNGEDWDAIGRREADKLVAAVERAAPGFASLVDEVHVQTPLDLERELGLRQGQVMHLEMTLDQMFLWRPLPEMAGYRAVPGLYLCGASTHPGGGVFGASGRTVAQLVLRDRPRRGARRVRHG
ncbi:MAG TPA: NAD(P)/FAD-dependent oxidoreductase [Mycobacteriales bacterium]|nr:NAD(P)/FAD-dependent oxidoreductase [Mycobacteriales bacterium]